MNSVLDVSGLTKSYRDFSLNDINISLERGTLTGFVGPNGAGKTTTIKCILNMVRPDAGSITVLGMDSAQSELALKSKVGMVLDDGYFYENLTLEKMKALVAPMYNTWNERLYSNYMDAFGLPQGKRISELSRGMRMKYTLALALSHDAELFILDEPTAGLDPLVRTELMEIMRSIIEDGDKTILMSTHITSDLDRLADYLYFILDGRIILSGAKDDIRESHAIVTGPAKAITPELERYFVSLSATSYSFEGLTDSKRELSGLLSGDNIYFEKPTIEDIMLHYSRRAEH